MKLKMFIKSIECNAFFSKLGLFNDFSPTLNYMCILFIIKHTIVGLKIDKNTYFRNKSCTFLHVSCPLLAKLAH